MIKIIKTFLTVCLALVFSAASAQEDIEMADVMRSNGSIYVVVAIILIILFGLIAYLFTLDRKISRLEKEIKKGS